MASHEFIKVCPTCGAEFKTTNDSQRFCSWKCRRPDNTSSPIERFMSHLIKLDNGCWEWDTVTKTGYGGPFGAGGRGGKNYRPHRWSYEYFRGPIPEGMTIDHVCHNPDMCTGGTSCTHRRCVNPDHMDVVTTQVNTARGHGPKRGIAASNAKRAAKTHCPQGHEKTPDNTRVYNGSMHCMICKRERRYPKK